MPSPTSARSALRLTGAGLLAWCALVAPLTPARSADAPADAAAAPALSPRDTARKVIEPVVDIFSKEPEGASRALNMRFRLAESTDQPPDLQGSELVFRCQPPDKVLFQFAALGTIVTVSRVGQTVWVSPASKLQSLLDQVKQKPPTKADKEPLAPLVLKVPKTLFWLLFRFVSIRDAGTATLDGVSCRKLDMDPPDDDDKNAKPDKNKYVRFWVRADKDQLARVDWHNSDGHGTLAVEETKFSRDLPADAFQPNAAQRADMMEVPIPEFRPLMTLLGKEEEKRAKAQVAAQKAAAKTP